MERVIPHVEEKRKKEHVRMLSPILNNLKLPTVLWHPLLDFLGT